MPKVATPKSSAAVEALAVIIGIKNRRMWQSLPAPLVLGLGDSGGVMGYPVMPAAPFDSTRRRG